MAWTKVRFRRTPDNKTPIVPLVRKRIRIPQPPTKPIDIHSKDLIRREYVNLDPWWFKMRHTGPRREKIGDDPQEKRAIPKSMVRGTLPERILYNALVSLLHLSPGVDFDFQSSQSGGRIELGGIVADFLFPIMRMIIQVQGPTHNNFLRGRKDQEQRDILTDMGYQVFEISDEMIYNETRFENWLRNLFNIGGVGGGGGGNWSPESSAPQNITPSNMQVANNADSFDATQEAVIGNVLSILEELIKTYGYS